LNKSLLARYPMAFHLDNASHVSRSTTPAGRKSNTLSMWDRSTNVSILGCLVIWRRAVSRSTFTDGATRIGHRASIHSVRWSKPIPD
jgi:hypothetical protein